MKLNEAIIKTMSFEIYEEDCLIEPVSILNLYDYMYSNNHDYPISIIDYPSINQINAIIDGFEMKSIPRIMSEDLVVHKYRDQFGGKKKRKFR